MKLPISVRRSPPSSGSGKGACVTRSSVRPLRSSNSSRPAHAGSHAVYASDRSRIASHHQGCLEDQVGEDHRRPGPDGARPRPGREAGTGSGRAPTTNLRQRRVFQGGWPSEKKAVQPPTLPPLARQLFAEQTARAVRRQYHRRSKVLASVLGVPRLWAFRFGRLQSIRRGQSPSHCPDAGLEG